MCKNKKNNILKLMLYLMPNFLKWFYLQVLLILSIRETKSILYKFWTLTLLVSTALRLRLWYQIFKEKDNAS